jgi:MoxR-like ATPase
VGASNALPEDEGLAAFADRFLVRIFVDRIPDPRLEELLEGGWALDTQPPGRTADAAHLDLLATASRQVDFAPLRPQLAHAVRLLRAAGIVLSDRRVVRVQRLVAAAAVLAGRRAPSEADLWPLILAVPTREQQSAARECLADVLARSENATLVAAAEETSLGPLARATRLVRAGRDILAARPADADADGVSDWQLRLEGIVREIDASFAAETLPVELAELRGQIVTGLGARPAGQGR